MIQNLKLIYKESIMNITKKITAYVFGLVMLVSFSASAVEFRGGVTLTGNGIYASGTETLKDSGKKSHKEVAAIIQNASVFGEVASDMGLALGVSYTPEYADLPKESRRDNANTTTNGLTDQTNTVDGKVNDALEVYLTMPIGDGGLYAKVGGLFAEIVINENLATGAQYGDVDAQAAVLGMGYQGTLSDNIFWRVEGAYMQFEDITEKGSANGTTTTQNEINVELTGARAALSVGMAF